MALIGTNDEIIEYGDELFLEDDDVVSDVETDIIEEPDDDNSIPEEDTDTGYAAGDTSEVVMELADYIPADENDIIGSEDEDITEYETTVEDEEVEPINDNQALLPCIGSVSEGDRVMIALVDGEATVIGVAGWGDTISSMAEEA